MRDYSVRAERRARSAIRASRLRGAAGLGCADDSQQSFSYGWFCDAVRGVCDRWWNGLAVEMAEDLYVNEFEVLRTLQTYLVCFLSNFNFLQFS